MVSRQSLHELFEVRRLLESEAVRQATPLVPDDVLDELEVTLTHSQEQLAAGDVAGHHASDVRMHETLRSYIQNSLLKEMLEGLNNHVSMLRRMGHLQPGQHLAESLKEHRAILRAIRARDADQAEAAMSRHLENSAVRLESLFD
jgi:DNA-binding GntR family transcriptional regulator